MSLEIPTQQLTAEEDHIYEELLAFLARYGRPTVGLRRELRHFVRTGGDPYSRPRGREIRAELAELI